MSEVMDPSESSMRCAAAILAAQRGDPSAIGVLFVELQPGLLRFLRARDRSAADDLAAEVWVAVARSIGRFRGDGAAFRAWFFTIARRRLVDHQRTASRRRTDPVENARFNTVPAVDEPEQAVLDLLSGQEAVDLIAAILSPEQAEVLLLRVLGDLAVEQVATVVGRPPTWVRVTQHRALRNLEHRLGSRIRVTP